MQIAPFRRPTGSPVPSGATGSVAGTTVGTVSAEEEAYRMYPWYRDSVSQLGQFGSPLPTAIKTETGGYNDCMLALEYGAQSKVSRERHLSFRTTTSPIGTPCPPCWQTQHLSATRDM